MELYDIIAIIWITWTGVFGLSITIISGSEMGKNWSVKKITLLSLLIATIITLTLLIVLYQIY